MTCLTIPVHHDDNPLPRPFRTPHPRHRYCSGSAVAGESDLCPGSIWMPCLKLYSAKQNIKKCKISHLLLWTLK